MQWGFASRNNLVGLLGTFATESASSMWPVREAFYIYSPDPKAAEPLFQANPAPAYKWYNDTSQHAAYGGGPDWHGRGFIQTTHKSGYEAVKAATGLDVVADPDLLLQPGPAAQAAMVYWTNRGIATPAEAKNWAEVRKRVYGGSDPAGAARIARIDAALP